LFKYLIAVEGIDGAGKTTIVNMIGKRLKELGYNVLITKEPFNEDIIGLINKFQWNDPIILALLFSLDRAIHIKWLEEKETDFVITDRYFYSTIAYQGALGIDINWLESLNKVFPKPNLTLLLDIEPRIAIKRIKKGDLFNFNEKLNSLNRVREIYLILSRIHPEIIIIDSSKPLEEVFKIAFEYVKNLIS
jgi:dTMP kinase